MRLAGGSCRRCSGGRSAGHGDDQLPVSAAGGNEVGPVCFGHESLLDGDTALPAGVEIELVNLDTVEEEKAGSSARAFSNRIHNNSSCHTIHVHASSSFARVGGWVGGGVGGVGSSGLVSVGDDACMDGTLDDGIQSAPACVNSRFNGSPGTMMAHVPV